MLSLESIKGILNQAFKKNLIFNFFDLNSFFQPSLFEKYPLISDAQITKNMDELIIENKSTGLGKTFRFPRGFDRKGIFNDYWDYVELYLESNKMNESAIYWQQAREFYKASIGLPNTSSSFNLYHCFLNATKALLTAKGLSFTLTDELSDFTGSGQTRLANIKITFHPDGVLHSLSRYFEDTGTSESHHHSFKDLLYNLNFLQKAFSLTYKNQRPQMFIPIYHPHFLKDYERDVFYLRFIVMSNFANGYTAKKICAQGFSDRSDDYSDFISNDFFEWSNLQENKDKELHQAIEFHKKQRRTIQYELNEIPKWYLKRTGIKHTVDKHPLTIMLAGMKKISELTTPNPVSQVKSLNSQENWLMTEFVENSPKQFIDQISCEITDESLVYRPS